MNPMGRHLIGLLLPSTHKDKLAGGGGGGGGVKGTFGTAKSLTLDEILG